MNNNTNTSQENPEYMYVVTYMSYKIKNKGLYSADIDTPLLALFNTLHAAKRFALRCATLCKDAEFEVYEPEDSQIICKITAIVPKNSLQFVFTVSKVDLPAD